MDLNKFIADYIAILDAHLDSFRAISSVEFSIGETVTVSGDGRDAIRENLISFDDGNNIHQPGVYILCSGDEVLYIGEGAAGKNGKGGNTGHRVYTHLKEKEWADDIRKIFFVPIYPGYVSRQGEQTALLLHHALTESLPKHQKIWR